MFDPAHDHFLPLIFCMPHVRDVYPERHPMPAGPRFHPTATARRETEQMLCVMQQVTFVTGVFEGKEAAAEFRGLIAWRRWRHLADGMLYSATDCRTSR